MLWRISLVYCRYTPSPFNAFIPLYPVTRWLCSIPLYHCIRLCADSVQPLYQYPVMRWLSLIPLYYCIRLSAGSVQCQYTLYLAMRWLCSMPLYIVLVMRQLYSVIYAILIQRPYHDCCSVLLIVYSRSRTVYSIAGDCHDWQKPYQWPTVKRNNCSGD